MARILAIRFSSCPGPHRAGVEGAQLMAALGPWHTVDGLVVRDGDQPFFETLHRGRLLRVPLGQGTPEERLAAFGRAAARQLDAEEYGLVWLGSTRVAGALVGALPPGLPLVVEPAAGDPTAGEDGAPPSWAARASVVVARSEAGAAVWRGALGDGVAVEVVPPGVDVDRFDREEAPAGPPCVMACGLRGLDRLAAAVAQLGGLLRLVVPGAVGPATRTSIEELAPGLIDWPGPLDHEEMPALHAASIGCVAPAPLDEEAGPPPLLLEAMACARVAVAPAAPLTERLLDGGRAGLLLPPEPRGPLDSTAAHGIASLATALGRLAADPFLRVALGGAARSLVREHATASARRRHLRSLAARLVAGSPATD